MYKLTRPLRAERYKDNQGRRCLRALNGRTRIINTLKDTYTSFCDWCGEPVGYWRHRAFTEVVRLPSGKTYLKTVPPYWAIGWQSGNSTTEFHAVIKDAGEVLVLEHPLPGTHVKSSNPEIGSGPMTYTPMACCDDCEVALLVRGGFTPERAEAMAGFEQ
jgi:hypothetical protein